MIKVRMKKRGGKCNGTRAFCFKVPEPKAWRIHYVRHVYLRSTARIGGALLEPILPRQKSQMDAAYMSMIKQTKITISLEKAKKLAAPGGGCEPKETSLHERFL